MLFRKLDATTWMAINWNKATASRDSPRTNKWVLIYTHPRTGEKLKSYGNSIAHAVRAAASYISRSDRNHKEREEAAKKSNFLDRLKISFNHARIEDQIDHDNIINDLIALRKMISPGQAFSGSGDVLQIANDEKIVTTELEEEARSWIDDRIKEVEEKREDLLNYVLFP